MVLCYAASLRQKVDEENPFDSVLSVETNLKALDEVFLKKKKKKSILSGNSIVFHIQSIFSLEVVLAQGQHRPGCGAVLRNV